MDNIIAEKLIFIINKFINKIDNIRSIDLIDRTLINFDIYIDKYISEDEKRSNLWKQYKSLIYSHKAYNINVNNLIDDLNLMKVICYNKLL